MTYVKSLIFVLLLVLAVACGQQKAAQPGGPVADSEENRLAAAKEYLKMAPPKDLLNDFTKGVVDHLPEQYRKPYLTVISSPKMAEAADQIVLKALVKHFTPNEIKAMIAFYSTPEGKSILHKDMAFRAEVMSGLNSELMNEFKQAVHGQQPEAPAGPKPPPTGKPPAEPQAQPGPASPKPGVPPAK